MSRARRRETTQANTTSHHAAQTTPMMQQERGRLRGRDQLIKICCDCAALIRRKRAALSAHTEEHVVTLRHCIELTF
jgi:hypothetical protein